MGSAKKKKKRRGKSEEERGPQKRKRQEGREERESTRGVSGAMGGTVHGAVDGTVADPELTYGGTNLCLTLEGPPQAPVAALLASAPPSTA